ncbi:hypothetical protein OQA88_12992 [Cercophora sp. LCS_1]
MKTEKEYAIYFMEKFIELINHYIGQYGHEDKIEPLDEVIAQVIDEQGAKASIATMAWQVHQAAFFILRSSGTKYGFKKPKNGGDWQFIDWTPVLAAAKTSGYHLAQQFRLLVEMYVPEVRQLDQLPFATGQKYASFFAACPRAPHQDTAPSGRGTEEFQQRASSSGLSKRSDGAKPFAAAASASHTTSSARPDKITMPPAADVLVMSQGAPAAAAPIESKPKDPWGDWYKRQDGFPWTDLDEQFERLYVGHFKLPLVKVKSKKGQSETCLPPWSVPYPLSATTDVDLSTDEHGDEKNGKAMIRWGLNGLNFHIVERDGYIRLCLPPGYQKAQGTGIKTLVLEDVTLMENIPVAFTKLLFWVKCMAEEKKVIPLPFFLRSHPRIGNLAERRTTMENFQKGAWTVKSFEVFFSKIDESGKDQRLKVKQTASIGEYMDHKARPMSEEQVIAQNFAKTLISKRMGIETQEEVKKLTCNRFIEAMKQNPKLSKSELAVFLAFEVWYRAWNGPTAKNFTLDWPPHFLEALARETKEADSQDALGMYRKAAKAGGQKATPIVDTKEKRRSKDKEAEKIASLTKDLTLVEDSQLGLRKKFVSANTFRLLDSETVRESSK